MMKINYVSQETLLNQPRPLTNAMKTNSSWKIPVADHFMPEELVVIKYAKLRNNNSGAVCRAIPAF
ncbi:MAG TPA: hypothetical protein VGH42_04465 [Verrucomicrobiae bacterium]|jgi:hypothetical protein